MSKTSQLVSLIDHYAFGNKAEFARMIGISPQNLHSWLKGGFMDVEKVFGACEGVSAEWLLTGDGEMLACNRPFHHSASDTIIPIVLEKDLLSGEWFNKNHFVLVRGASYTCDFFTQMPSGDLGQYIYPTSVLFCLNKTIDSLIKDCLYIIHTAYGSTVFVQYAGSEGEWPNAVYKFTTRRSGSLDVKFEIPYADIKGIAEIAQYTVDHYVVNLGCPK